MKLFAIQKSQNKDYPFVIFSTSYQSPLSQVPIIQKEIALDGFEGNILFDLLLSNGYASNRFLSIPFRDGKFDVHNVSTIADIPIDVLQLSGDFYSSHPEYVRRSSLRDAEIKRILKRK